MSIHIVNNSILFRNLPEVNSLKSKEDVGREVDDMEKKFIGDRITELRIKKNVSEYQMSLDLGKNKSYIQSISSGRSLPTMENFLEICEYLEVTPCQFFDTALHNLPLYEKAADLLKQLDDEDMIAVISILHRLAARHK